VATAPLVDRLAALPLGDRRLIVAMGGLALLALVPGIGMGALTAFARAGWLAPAPDTAHAWLGWHGASVFFFWLYLAQGALLLALAAAEPGAAEIRHRGLASGGAGLVAIGLLLAWVAPLAGPPLLYDAPPTLAGEAPAAAGIAAASYLALGAGLAGIALAALATLLAAKRRNGGGPWSALGFGLAAWAGLLLVTALAAVATFLPAALWAVGLGPLPDQHATRWHLLFHNLHYLPLMGTVLVWYALLPELTGVRSILGERFSKGAFALYLLLVPPTSLYHMFLEPDLAPPVRLLGSVLSLLIGVPTVAVFLVLTVSLEAALRARGARGPLGWLRALPWGEPTFAALAAAVVNLALGGTFAFVLIQERLAPLLSDTVFVPAYFHFLTVGTVSLTALAGLGRLLPALVGGAVPAPRARTLLPWLSTLGLVLFGFAGVTAGLAGMPRRTLDLSYDGVAPAAWAASARAIALGAGVMATALAGHALLLAAGLLGLGRRPARSLPVAPSPALDAVLAAPAWGGPVAVGLLLTAIAATTWIAVRVMHALPLSAVGAAGGH